MSTLYNDIDAYAVAWLKRLVDHGFLSDGAVDSRPVQEIEPDEARALKRVHWFAGIGGWDLALQWAGGDFPDGTWTGSCPCQPFSNAGQRKGISDDRHLWPHWFALIRECRPPLILGEQVEGAVAGGWIDEVADDLATIGYRLDAMVLPASIVGAPHLRHRIFFAAYPTEADLESDFDLFGDPLPIGLEPSERCRETIRWINTVATRISPEYLHGWKHLGTPAGRWIPVLRGQATNHAVLGWPTPQAHDAKGGKTPEQIERMRQESGAGVSNLNEKVHEISGWRSPQGRDGKGAHVDPLAILERFSRGSQVNLNEQARIAGWPSPAASRFNSGQDPESNQARRERMKARHGTYPGLTLDAAAKLAGWRSPDACSGHTRGIPNRGKALEKRIAEGRQIMLADEAGMAYTPEGGIAERGALAPEFSRWLMGYPAAWDALAVEECLDPPDCHPDPFASWDASLWIPCADAKLRRIGVGVRPLAETVKGRVGMLRGFGNAIVPQVAAVFVFAFMQAGVEAK